MTTEILYPEPPDIGFLDWSTNLGTVDRYDAINEGTSTPDQIDYVSKTITGDRFFDDIYEGGTFYDTVKPYYKKVRVNLGEMTVWPDSGGITMNMFATRPTADYYGSPSWGIGSFYGESDYLLDYWTLNDDSTGLVSKIAPGGFVWSDEFSPTAVAFAGGKQGNAAVFDGVGAYLSGPMGTTNNPRYRFDTNKSFGGWIYNGLANQDGMIYTLGDGTDRNSCCKLELKDGGVMKFSIYRTYTDAATGLLLGQEIANVTVTAPTVGVWSFVICSIDTAARKIKVSVNGGAYTETSYANYVINTNFSSVYLGGHPAVTYFGDLSSQSVDASYFKGRIDEWAIWDKDLSISEIQSLYNGGGGTTYPLDGIVDRRFTTLYDKNGLEIASVPRTLIASSGDLTQVNSSTPTLYSIEFSDISEQQPLWTDYDLSNVYVDLQLFTERVPTGYEYSSTGYGTVGTAASVSPGTDVWSNPYNAVSLDGSYATASSIGSDTEHLYLSNFGFSVPTDATITAVDLKVTSLFSEEPGGASNDIVLSLWLTDSSGNKIGSAQEYSPPGGSTYTISTNVLGTWGATLTPAIVNSSGFGVKLQYAGNGSKPYSGSIDYVSVSVRYYKPKPLNTKLNALIFTMDFEIDGQTIAYNSIPMYLHNTIEPDDIPLHIVSTETESGEVPLTIDGNESSSDNTTLHTWGITGDSGDITLNTIGGLYSSTAADLFLKNQYYNNNAPLFIHGHETESTGMDLYINGIESQYDSVDLMIANKELQYDCPLFLSGHESKAGDAPLNILGKDTATDSTPFFIEGVLSTDGSMNMSITGYGGDVSDSVALNTWATTNPGLRDVVNVFMKSENSGELDANMNLFIQAPAQGDKTSNMNMFLNSDIPTNSKSVNFFLANNYNRDSGETTLFIGAPGGADGHYPVSSNMNLFMARDSVYNWLSAPMFMMVASGDDENIPLHINSVSNTNASTTITIPNVSASDSGEITMYTHGF